MEITELCPCGLMPQRLDLIRIGDFHYKAFGNCCGKWSLMFDSLHEDRLLVLQDGISQWNNRTYDDGRW